MQDIWSKHKNKTNDLRIPFLDAFSRKKYNEEGLPCRSFKQFIKQYFKNNE